MFVSRLSLPLLMALGFISGAFSFSYADWDIELHKLVDNKTRLDVTKAITAQQIEKMYNLAKSGDIAGKLLKFTLRSTFWTGALYFGTESVISLMDYIKQQMEQQLDNDINPFVDVDNTSFSSFCFDKWQVSQVLSDDGYTHYSCAKFYIPSGFSDCSYRVGVRAVVSYHYVLDGVSYGGAKVVTESLANSITPNDYSCYTSSEAQNHFDLRQQPVVTAQQILSNPNYSSQIDEAIASMPVVASPNTNIPSVEIPVFPDDSVKVTHDNGDGTKTVEDVLDGNITPFVDDTDISEGTGETSSSKTQQLSEDYTFSSPGNLILPQFDTSLDVPEKKRVTTLIDRFLSNSPLVAILNNVDVSTSSGVCSIDIPISFHGFSSTGKLDFCIFADTISVVGSILLAFAHLYALLIIFRD